MSSSIIALLMLIPYRGGGRNASKRACQVFHQREPRGRQVGAPHSSEKTFLICTRIPKVTAHYADVSSQESVEAVIAEIIAEHGKIDNLVTSAGFTENFDAINYPIDRIRKLWGVNVDGYDIMFPTTSAKSLEEALQNLFQRIMLTSSPPEHTSLQSTSLNT